MINTLNHRPAQGAIILFNGRDLGNWKTRDGRPAGWQVEDGILVVVPKSGDIVSEETFGDFFLHLEFRCPDMPEATGQGKANSGVFLQGRYEIQVLDSYGWKVPGKGDCGAIYDQFAPLVNGCKPATEWQTYDVVFRAPRQDEGEFMAKGPRVTVFHNGQLIHNNLQLPGVTGGAVDQNLYEPGPLLLQDHNNLMAFRNIWAVTLPLKGSEEYGPR